MVINNADKTANYELHTFHTSHLLQLSITAYVYEWMKWMNEYCSCPSYMNTLTPLVSLLNSQDQDVVLKTSMWNLGHKPIMYAKGSNFFVTVCHWFQFTFDRNKVTLTNIQVPVMWCQATDECLGKLCDKDTNCEDAVWDSEPDTEDTHPSNSSCQEQHKII
jgi:hypothetical protein